MLSTILRGSKFPKLSKHVNILKKFMRLKKVINPNARNAPSWGREEEQDKCLNTEGTGKMNDKGSKKHVYRHHCQSSNQACTHDTKARSSKRRGRFRR